MVNAVLQSHRTRTRIDVPGRAGRQRGNRKEYDSTITLFMNNLKLSIYL